MSDARPITNITDFVCGNCWGTFSRTDAGVVQGDRAVCPHCGTPQALEGSLDQLAAAVRQAPSFPDQDSEELPKVGPTPKVSPTPQVSPTLLRDTTDFDRTGSAGPSPRAPTASRSPSGWLPPEQMSPHEPPAAQAPAQSSPQGAKSDLPSPKPEHDSGIMVGDPDDDFGGVENTLSGNQDVAALLEAVRQTSPVPRAFVAGEGYDDDADELSVTAEEPTPIDAMALSEAEMANSDADHALSEAEQAEMDAQAAAGVGPEGVADQHPGVPQHDPDLAHRDWKLKAMGITYNFHGLDPLFSWAANKAGQAMALSHDGETWKDFHSFYASIRLGIPVRQAFDEAPDPGSAAPPPVTPRVTRTMSQLRPELPELEGLRPPTESQPTDLSPARSASTSSNLAARSAATNPSIRAVNPSSSSHPALRGASKPSDPNIRASDAGRAMGSRSPSRNNPLGPSTSPSKRMPVASAGKQSPLTPPMIAGIVLLSLVIVAIALHFSKIVRIPGLP